MKPEMFQMEKQDFNSLKRCIISQNILEKLTVGLIKAIDSMWVFISSKSKAGLIRALRTGRLNKKSATDMVVPQDARGCRDLLTVCAVPRVNTLQKVSSEPR